MNARWGVTPDSEAAGAGAGGGARPGVVAGLAAGSGAPDSWSRRPWKVRGGGAGADWRRLAAVVRPARDLSGRVRQEWSKCSAMRFVWEEQVQAVQCTHAGMRQSSSSAEVTGDRDSSIQDFCTELLQPRRVQVPT